MLKKLSDYFFNKNTSHIYCWDGINKTGQYARGLLAANNVNDARHQLKQQNIYLINCKKHRAIFQTNKIYSQDILYFIQQFIILLKAQLSLPDCLLTLQKSYQYNIPFWLLLQKMINSISSGKTLAEAIRSESKHFTPLLCQLIEIGEKNGCLLDIMQQYVEQQQVLEKFVQQFKRSLYYPIFTLIITLIISIGLVTFIIPTFSALYIDSNTQIPMLTQIIINISEKIKYYSFGLGACFILLSILFYGARYTHQGLFFTDRIAIKLPLVSYFIKQVTTIRIMHTLQLLLQSGTPLLTSINYISNIINNTFIRKKLQQIHLLIQQGETLSTAFSNTDFFSDPLLQLLAIGEQSASLEAMLKMIVIQQKNALRQTISKLSQLLEPTIIVVLGGIVAIVIVALYLPIFQIGNIL